MVQHRYGDRILQSSTTTGTGTLTLAGTAVGHQSFSVIGDGNVTDYCIVAVAENGIPTGDWETGRGTYTDAGTTLSRTTVFSSSNAGALVDFAAGTKYVSVAPAAPHLRPPTVRGAGSQGPTAAQYGTLFIATGASTYTLPTIAAGLRYQFLMSTDANMSIVGDGDILADGNATADSITFNTASQKVGSYVEISAEETATGVLKWVVKKFTGNTMTVA